MTEKPRDWNLDPLIEDKPPYYSPHEIKEGDTVACLLDDMKEISGVVYKVMLEKDGVHVGVVFDKNKLPRGRVGPFVRSDGLVPIHLYPGEFRKISGGIQH